MNVKNLTLSAVAALALLGATVSANAITANFSFTGSFVNDNDVQLFNFTVGAASPDVILRTWSYAGGVNAAGETIAEGGFDPILAVFNGAGTFINQNDDGGAHVAADSITGAHFDTYLDLGALAVGSYTVSVMQYNNFANGPALANGFAKDGAANIAFTHTLFGHPGGLFWDATDHERTANWAFDILGVQQATQNGVPDGGSTVALLGLALSGLAMLRSRLQK
jgi:hypothetical protein